ncbi:hypothetical protein SSX86_012487 [Deinandra increscens subsp. villosa]|uniref:GAG-pre-integrase domain-containing protein n=1 Tax=Deinandra increscens subsp. villosa TaxID=3103831 RepID=A0AAP0D4T3_9ASTR
MASSSSPLNINGIFNSLIKLDSSTYLLWRNQLLPILTFQNLLPHIDGTAVAPPENVTSGDKPAPNPEYKTWKDNDQQTVIILHASLSKESAAVVVGLTTARQIWLALESAYGNPSVERIQLLRDSLRQMTKGDRSVAEYGREFKNTHDQLSAVGHRVDPSELNRWFVTGLGPSFLSFSSTAGALYPSATFSDLLAKAESFELLSRAISGQNPTPPPPVAFAAQMAKTPSTNPNPHRKSPGNYNRNRGNFNRNKNNHNSDPCQWCGIPGHKANVCRKLLKAMGSSKSGSSSNAPKTSAVDEDTIARAFAAQCNTGPSETTDPDWYVDSGASDHMSGMSNKMTNLKHKSGNSRVTFGDGNSLPVTHTGDSMIENNIKLKDVLLVPNIHKNLISVGKLTQTNDIDVLFSHPLFYIQDRLTRNVLAQGRCKDGLYVLETKNKAFVAIQPRPKASFEDWHARLGHASFEIIKNLQSDGVISATSLLPKPGVCSPCEMAKAHKLPFCLNEKRALEPLDLVHCDLWGPSPVTSIGNYRYYAAFVDDHSRFCWLYPLKSKNEFYNALVIF